MDLFISIPHLMYLSMQQVGQKKLTQMKRQNGIQAAVKQPTNIPAILNNLISFTHIASFFLLLAASPPWFTDSSRAWIFLTWKQWVCNKWVSLMQSKNATGTISLEIISLSIPLFERFRHWHVTCSFGQPTMARQIMTELVCCSQWEFPIYAVLNAQGYWASMFKKII